MDFRGVVCNITEDPPQKRRGARKIAVFGAAEMQVAIDLVQNAQKKAESAQLIVSSILKAGADLVKHFQNLFSGLVVGGDQISCRRGLSEDWLEGVKAHSVKGVTVHQKIKALIQNLTQCEGLVYLTGIDDHNVPSTKLIKRIFYDVVVISRNVDVDLNVVVQMQYVIFRLVRRFIVHKTDGI